MHAILHRAYHALPDFSTSKGEPSGALYGLAAMLLKIIADLKPDYIAAAYDLPKPTYRHEAYKDYKAGRAKTEDALIAQIERSRDVLKAFSIPSYEHEGFEADDILGTIVEQTKGDETLEVVIASGDMDTLQLVDKERVKVFTLRKGMNDTVFYGYDDVVTRFGFGPELLPDYKGLRGDPSDNIPGIKGIGEKTASTLITSFGGIEAIYRQLESDSAVFDELKITPRIQGILKEGKDEAQFSKLLGTIRRDAPIAFALPEKTWKETASPSVITALFTELDFRSFGARLKSILGAAAVSDNGTLGFPEAVDEKPKAPDITEDELKETKIALWLINSELTNPQPEDILSYARTDSLKQAREKIFADLDAAGLRHVFEDIEKPLIPVISAMIGNGIRVDVSYLKELSETYHKELSDLEKKIWGHAGKEFNINSPRQLGDVLFTDLGLKGGKKTSTGQRSTKESELDKLAGAHPVIREIIAYRELQKLLSTYIDAFPKMLDEGGRLHTTFIQTGAATGRMSSQAPELAEHSDSHGARARDSRCIYGRAWVLTRYIRLLSNRAPYRGDSLTRSKAREDIRRRR
jgi:DNA polymerase-1